MLEDFEKKTFPIVGEEKGGKKARKKGKNIQPSAGLRRGKCVSGRIFSRYCRLMALQEKHRKDQAL